ncbi:uncharacterized protein PV09_02505 [Verruconis gallopava]|uniref:Homeobox domain-containing protein n=1 Tax=Verruconis gallopava TaxID=253628 RepID=A0A0D2AJS5_9PEZI|nr:uncharacterized protein PV09_02505 [Verruconis gallopava]KIW06825.1 hypothetical protein PV09_02505 [Verruconis gallopava]
MSASGTILPWTTHATDLDHRAQSAGGFSMNGRPISQPAGPRPTTTVVQVCADVKPRLTKDQHEILERHFQAQPKPSTSVKKGFADALGVPLDKINNWFQNRRAKVKQDAKKQLNALQLFQATFGQQSQQYFAHPPQLAQQLPYHYGPLPVVPSNTEPAAESSAPPQPVIAAVTTDAMQNAISAPEGNFATAPEFSMQAPLMTSAPHGMAFEAQPFTPDMNGQPMFLQDVNFGPSFSQDFMAMPGNYDLFMQQAGAVSAVPVTMDTIPANVVPTPPAESASPNAVSSLTSPYVHQSQTEDEKPHLIVDSPQEVVELSAATGHPTPADSTTTWSSAAPGQEFYEQQNASAPVLAVNEQSPASVDSVERHESSGLTESMNKVGIDQPSSDSESSFKAPSEISGLAARRQKPRPANLMSTALRSTSYTAGVPGSPGANPNNQDQLRRIRSHGVGVNNGRITKPSGPQKSPMHANFDAAAIASPKFARHASNYSVSTINSSGPLTATTMPNSLAPPTPITPNELTRFPIGQAPGFGFPNGSPGGFGCEDPIYLDTSSPMAKLDMQQMEQYRANLMARHEASLFNTPPQSAPASQQHFGFTPPNMAPRMINGHSGLGHVRRPSLPGHTNQELNGQLQAPLLLQSGQGTQPPYNPHLAEAFKGDSNAFVMPQGLPTGDTFFQFMAPPHMNMNDSKLPVHFHNQTPEDFQNTVRPK